MKRNVLGVGMIEVLVSLLILAIAVLGFSAMQVQSIKSTTESVDRSQTLLMMRSMAEKIRANSSAIDAYKTAFNQIRTNSFSQPTNLCVPTTNDNGLCNSTDLAKAEVWQIKQQLDATALSMDLQPCPSSGGGGANSSTNIMYSYCLITAWGNTTPTIGSDSDPSKATMDCITDRIEKTASVTGSTGGTYHPSATCMFMEIN